MTKKYTNGEVTIVWKPDLCCHSGICVSELPEVFQRDNIPWIDPMGATTGRIIEQVERCPTEALSYFRNDSKI